MTLTYFTERDFANAVPPCRLTDMDSDFMQRLDLARDVAGVPFIVNSAFRSVAHELSKGRNGKSSHTKGVAIDIRARDNVARYHIVRGLMAQGFQRILIYPTFIHVDADETKPQNILVLS